MIFQHTWQQVLSGQKTQTRRLVQPGDYTWVCGEVPGGPRGYRLAYSSIHLKSGRPRWVRDQTYAVCPGRGQAAVARIKITTIYREHLQDITLEEVKAEGIAQYTFARGVLSANPPDPRWAFIELWNSIHAKPGTRWEDNPEVFVLTFEVIT